MSNLAMEKLKDMNEEKDKEIEKLKEEIVIREEQRRVRVIANRKSSEKMEGLREWVDELKAEIKRVKDKHNALLHRLAPIGDWRIGDWRIGDESEDEDEEESFKIAE
jgi:cell division protein FtsB